MFILVFILCVIQHGLALFWFWVFLLFFVGVFWVCFVVVSGFWWGFFYVVQLILTWHDVFRSQKCAKGSLGYFASLSFCWGWIQRWIEHLRNSVNFFSSSTSVKPVSGSYPFKYSDFLQIEDKNSTAFYIQLVFSILFNFFSCKQ